MNEIWKNIPNYEGLYQISNMGNVKALHKKSGFLFRKEKLLRPTKKSNGYFQIDLIKNRVREKRYIHRLVGELFVPNPNNYPCIHHKDHNRANNIFSNLEWCTYVQNNKYSNCAENGAKNRRVVVLQYSKDGKFLKEWESIREAGRYVGDDAGAAISACCSGKTKSSHGYIWKYKCKRSSTNGLGFI